jgi:hypothetical protein
MALWYAQRILSDPKKIFLRALILWRPTAVGSFYIPEELVLENAGSVDAPQLLWKCCFTLPFLQEVSLPLATPGLLLAMLLESPLLFL